MKPTPEQIVAGWRESARYWEKHAPLLRQMFAPLTRAMLEAADFLPGQQVLDVAGGTGEPSATIAEKVGPRGSVVCTDVAEEMVAAARRQCAERGISNISFRCCGADALPFEDERFDHVVCRLGTMFFPDVGVALREMLRVTKPRGRCTLAVWSDPEANPLFTAVTDVLARHIPSPPEPPDAPGPFRFSDPGHLAGIVRQAGARDVIEQPLRFTIEAPLSFDEFWLMRSEISDSLRSKLQQLPPERVSAIVSDLRRGTSRYFDGKSIRLPAAAIVVTAVKPPPG